jgi:hypothetical protein
MNFLIPKRKRKRGIKEAINQERFLDKPRSYQKTFFKVNPKVRKEVKQVIIPNKNPRRIILFPRIKDNPEIASFEVFGPEVPKTIKINNK